MYIHQIRLAHGFSRALTTGSLTLVALFCMTEHAESALRHSVIWYTPATNQNQIVTTAQRYEMGVTGITLPPENIVDIRELNPNFKWFVYNSGSDNYVPPHISTPEHDLLVQKAQARGWDPEEGYLHYWDDTQIQLDGATINIPGWGGGSATNPADARVPAYYKSLIRRVINASTPRARQLQKELIIELGLDEPFTGSNIYPDGIFLDNSTWQLFNYGVVVSGGRVRETPGHLVLGTPAFHDWYWNQNYAPLLTALKDTMETASSWSKDRKPKELMINIANSWTDSYVSLDVADILVLEFRYNPVRDFGVNMVPEAYRRDRLAADAGIASLYSATMMRSVNGRPGTFDFDEIMLSNLAWYLTTRTELTYFFEHGTSAPNTAGWDSLTWRGCLDVANNDLGEAVGAPYLVSQGIDPLGNNCAVYGRAYDNGLVLVRARGDWDEGVEPQTAIPVSLPEAMYPVNPDGTNGSPVNQITLRNGQGAILLSSPVSVDLLSFTATRSDEGALLRWEIAGEMSDVAGFHVYRETEGGERQRLTTSLLSGSLTYTFVDPDPPAQGTRYWLSELSRDGRTDWHGPVLLLGLEEPVRLALTQNRPNPFRERTEWSIALASAMPSVRLRVLDLGGREVARLLDGPVEAGSHLVTWDGRDARGARLAPGLYIYEMQTPTQAVSSKLVLLP